MSINEEKHDMGEDVYYIYTEEGWSCGIGDETIPMAFVVEFINSSLWESDTDYWECHCGVIPASADIFEDLTYHGMIGININGINPKEELPFEKTDYIWILKDKSQIEKAAEIAKGRAESVMGLIGFFLDRPYNRIGQTGWDIISEWLGKSTFKEWINAKSDEIKQG